SLHPVGEVLHCELRPGRRRIGPMVVLADDDQRATLHGGEVYPLMERAGRHAAVPDVHQSDARLAAQPEGERDAGHDGEHVAEVGDMAEGAELEVVDVDVYRERLGWAARLRIAQAIGVGW